jgi:hypothetical protein
MAHSRASPGSQNTATAAAIWAKAIAMLTWLNRQRATLP